MFNKHIGQLAIGLVCLSLANVGCAQQTRLTTATHATPKLTAATQTSSDARKIGEKIKNAPVAIILDDNGEAIMVGKGLTHSEPCYKDAREAKRNGGKQCSAFSGKRDLEDVQTFTVVKSKGSYIYCYIDSLGQTRQICYNDYWQIIDCP